MHDAPKARIIDLPEQYRAGREAAVLLDRPDVTRLLIRGRDALDLLHRLSTNALKALRAGEGAATVFTTNKGRILDLVTLHLVPVGILALCGADRSSVVREWIERYTFREDVQVEELTASHGTLGIHGPRSSETVAALWGPAAGGLPRHHVAEATAGGSQAFVVRTFPIGGDGYLLTAPREALESARREILQSDGPRPVEAGADCLEILRIEAGLPAAGRELTEDYNPWEARLQDAISLDKGCYVGQEVIARLNTYQKVSRQLVRIAAGGTTAALARKVVVAGAPIRIGGEDAGLVTSSAGVPGGGDRIVALGYVRHQDAAADRPVEIGRDDRVVPAIIQGVAR
jgi:aminomethyltransferase